MKILYVTTFNKDIFGASGKDMLHSFFSTQKNGDVLICYESLNEDTFKHEYKKSFSRVKLYDLSKDQYLNDWLKENQDVIPVEYGGLAKQEKSPEVYLSWNFRASKWFRKIAAMNHAVKYSDQYDMIVFIDSDCKFLKNIDKDLYNNVLSSSSYFYHWGKERRKIGLAVESGFIGFKTNEVGLSVLNKWIEKFSEKTFRRYMRWDDGGMFSNILHEIKFKNGNDVVTNYGDIGKSQSHVIDRGAFAGYLIHDKGSHKRLGLTKEKIRK